MSANDARQVSSLSVVVSHVARWLRDEEAGSSNLPTPTQVKGHVPSPGGMAFFAAVQQQSTAAGRQVETLRGADPVN